MSNERPYADLNHPGNRIRPRVRCIGCGTKGCTTAWGPWCFTCNVQRIDRISGFLGREIERYETAEHPAISEDRP